MKFTKDIQEVFPDGKITEAQLEILDMFSLNLTSSEVNELKGVLSSFLLRRADRMIEQMENNGKYPSNKEIDQIHVRTPYRVA